MVLEIVIDNRMRFNKNDIPKEVLKEIKKVLIHKNPKYFKMRACGFFPRGVPQAYSTYDIEGKEISIYRGAIVKVRKILKQHGIEFTIIDKTTKKPFDGELENNMIPRSYQELAILRMTKAVQGILQGVVASGKTEMMWKAACELNQWTLIIVPTEILQGQWIEAICNRSQFTLQTIGKLGGKGKNRLAPVTVAIDKSVINHIDELKDMFGCIIYDEAHRTAADTILKTIDKFSAKYRFGGTATPYRKDGLEKLMFDLFGNVFAAVTEDDMKDAGVYIDVKIKVVPTNFYYTEYDPNDYNEYLRRSTMNKERSNLIYQYVRKDMDEEQFGIILSDRTRFCHNWKKWLGMRGIEAKLMIGGQDNKQECDEAKEEMLEGKLHMAIGTNVADEGLNINNLNRMYITTPTANNKRRITQQRGRLARKADGKKDAIVYYFWDWQLFGEFPIRNLMKYFGETVEILSITEEWMDAKSYMREFSKKQLLI